MIASSISMAMRFAVLITLTLTPALGLSQCAAEPNSTFRPFKGGEDKPAGHFEWDSSASPNHDRGGGHPDNAVERHVHNLSIATTLKYSWPIGRMHNDALTQGKTDSYCDEVTWPNQNSGPLNYGRGNDKNRYESMGRIGRAEGKHSSCDFFVQYHYRRRAAGDFDAFSQFIQKDVARCVGL